MLFFQIQEIEAVDPEIDNLVCIFFAAISYFEDLPFALLGGLEPPTFRLTADGASRLRHKSSLKILLWKNLFLSAWNLLTILKNSEFNWRFQRS